MSVVILIGRILLGLIFVGSGVGGHLMKTDDTATYAAMRGVQPARPLVQISGVLITAAGLGVILGVWADLAALGIVAYCLIAAFWVHHFWSDEGMTQQIEMTNFMKNLSIAGGALLLFAFLAIEGLGAEVDFMITDPLFEFDL